MAVRRPTRLPKQWPAHRFVEVWERAGYMNPAEAAVWPTIVCRSDYRTSV